jgi:hypothetical protein
VKVRHACFTDAMTLHIVDLDDGTPSWPVDEPKCGPDGVSERELWFAPTVFAGQVAMELRSAHPLTTGAYRAAARELLRIADDCEAELPELS